MLYDKLEAEYAGFYNNGSNYAYYSGLFKVCGLMLSMGFTYISLWVILQCSV